VLLAVLDSVVVSTAEPGHRTLEMALSVSCQFAGQGHSFRGILGDLCEEREHGLFVELQQSFVEELDCAASHALHCCDSLIDNSSEAFHLGSSFLQHRMLDCFAAQALLASAWNADVSNSSWAAGYAGHSQGNANVVAAGVSLDDRTASLIQR
jgi:malonyl CoA-acyl carrier protein transacylase